MPSPSLVIKFYLFYHQNISRIHHIASTSVVTPLTSHFSPLTALLTLLFRCHPPKNVIHQTSGWVTLITQTLPISPHYLKNQVQTLCISIKTEPFSALLYLHAHCTLSKPFFFLYKLSESSEELSPWWYLPPLPSKTHHDDHPPSFTQIVLDISEPLALTVDCKLKNWALILSAFPNIPYSLIPSQCLVHCLKLTTLLADAYIGNPSPFMPKKSTLTMYSSN